MCNNFIWLSLDCKKKNQVKKLNKYKGILESKGVKQITAKGEIFNSDIHEAIVNVPVEDESQKGKVIEDIEKGYYLNDKVIRFSKVVVGQ